MTVSDPTSERFLVTGALGCVGAWTVKTLVDEGALVVTFDQAGDTKRLRLVMGPDGPSRVTMLTGDITDAGAVAWALDEYDINRVIHLAALQLPFAKADPPLGAMVNVVGTINLFEAVKARRDRIGPIAYAGSIAMFDATDADPNDGRLREDATPHPMSHYGVFKLANEGNARIYANDDGVASVGLRPMVIFGPGRDQGLTSDPSRAVLSALLGREFEIGFGGRVLFQFAPDVARAFVTASRSTGEGARVYNLDGTLTSVDGFIEVLARELPGAAGLVRRTGAPLRFPEEIESASLRELGDIPVTPLGDAVATTIAIFRERLDQGQLDPSEHGLGGNRSGRSLGLWSTGRAERPMKGP
jgi:UDP-glucuronate 4-epimerase